jgi:hypothetical protein
MAANLDRLVRRGKRVPEPQKPLLHRPIFGEARHRRSGGSAPGFVAAKGTLSFEAHGSVSEDPRSGLMVNES